MSSRRKDIMRLYSLRCPYFLLVGILLAHSTNSAPTDSSPESIHTQESLALSSSQEQISSPTTITPSTHQPSVTQPQWKLLLAFWQPTKDVQNDNETNTPNIEVKSSSVAVKDPNGKVKTVEVRARVKLSDFTDGTHEQIIEALRPMESLFALSGHSGSLYNSQISQSNPTHDRRISEQIIPVTEAEIRLVDDSINIRSRKVTREIGDIEPTRDVGVIEPMNTTVVDPPTESTVVLNEQLATSDPTQITLQNNQLPLLSEANQTDLLSIETDKFPFTIQINQSDMSPTAELRLKKLVAKVKLREGKVDMHNMFSSSEETVNDMTKDNSLQINHEALEINSEWQEIMNNKSESLPLSFTNESEALDSSISNNDSVSILSSSSVINESILDNSSESEELKRPKELLRSLDMDSQTQNDMAAAHSQILTNKEIMKEVVEEVLESAKKKVSEVLHGLENIDAPVPRAEAPQVMEALNEAQHLTFHSKEILTLERDRSTIFAILQVAQDTNTLEDPFQVSSMMEAERHAGIDGGAPTSSSGGIPVVTKAGSPTNFNGGAPTGTSLTLGDPSVSALYTSTDAIAAGRTPKVSESFEGQVIIPDHQHSPLTIITDEINNIPIYDIDKPDKTKGKKKKIDLVDELDISNVEEKKAISQNSVVLDGEIFSVSEMNEEYTVRNETEAIYEEIAATLKVDTSIRDVEDFDITIKSTENTDEYLPKGNHTRPNLIEPELVRDIQNSQPSSSDSIENVQTNSLDVKTNLNQQIDGGSAYAYQIVNIHEENTSESNADKNNSELNDSQSIENTNDIQINFEETMNSEPKHPVIIINSEISINEQKLPDQNINAMTPKPTMMSEDNEINFIKVISASDEYLTQNGINAFEAVKPSAQEDQVIIDVTQTASDLIQAAINNTGDSENDTSIVATTTTMAPITTTPSWYNETAFLKAMGNGTNDPYALVLKERASLMLELMDPSVDPCNDFYQFACGRWRNNFPLREDKAVDNTFERLKEDLDEVLRTLLEKESLPDESASTTAAKMLYQGCMNTNAIETLGAQPLLELLRDLGGWPVLDGDDWDKDAFNWVELMARLRTFNNDILISEWVAADITNSSNHIVLLDQADLGLPGREYYTNPGDHHYREAYLFLMLKVCRLLGADEVRSLEEMGDVLYFEKQLSRILTPSEERRNLSAVHRHMTIWELQETVPDIDWQLYLSIVTGDSTNSTQEVVVFGLDYFRKLVRLINDTNNRTLSNYLLWRFIKNRIANLDESFLEVKQSYIKVLFGRQSQPERWRSCVSYVSGNIGYVVGAMFVKRYFPAASKNDTEEMITLIRESFIEAVQEADWMSSRTRDVAIEKVETIVRNIGYPDQILNDTYMNAMYEGLNFTSTNHFSNVLQMLQYHAASAHDLLKVPVDRKAWVTTPAVVNAYYSRSKNMIVFPAGILQPPFYHPAFPRSLNFGGIGVVIGHEITHGFDDQGRQFDKNGNLQQWWSAEDVSQFYKRALCMLDQYGEYEVGDAGLKVNPINTLGENIADNAGVKIAFKAYKKWTLTHEEHATLPHVNLSHDQLFFINFGQIWCEVNSPEAMLTKIRSGQHSPNKFRVIGTLSNSYEFSEAFHCPVGSKMNPQKKCKVW